MFAEYLRSPLHSHRPKLAEMVELMLENGLLDGGQVSPEEYWEKIYPEKDYNGNMLSRLLSEIASNFKSFLGFRRYQKDSIAQEVNVLWEFQARDWEEELKKGVREISKKMENSFTKDDNFYYHRLQVSRIKMIYDSQNLGKDPGPIFQNCLTDLEKFYLLNKMKFSVLSRNYDNLHATRHEGLYKEASIPFERLMTPDDQILFLYDYFLDLLDHQEDLDRFKFFLEHLFSSTGNVLKAESGLISKEDAEFFYSYCRNIASDRLIKRQLDWAVPMKELCEDGLDKGILLDKGKISQRFFTSTMGLMSRLGFHEWVESFIKTYGPVVKNDPNGVIMDFANGVNAFYQRDYQACKKRLLNFKNNITQKTDPGIVMNARSMLVRVWWLEDDLDAFLHEANSFRVYLDRQRHFSKRTSGAFRNFCTYALKMERAINSSREKRQKVLTALVEELQDKRVALKSWIVQNLEQAMEKK